MPLNKLDNFIKNTEGRILYVSPSDLDSTDSISNEGNSLARPFKTIQRALLESARFSYVRGRSNDIVEKTTILLLPGEHYVDNRPGLAIYDDSGTARVREAGQETSGNAATSTLNLNLNSNFDLAQEDNILYKFNSVNGGAIVPRGTSIVGLDLRKTKIRPKYVPNPTDPTVAKSSIFKITGSCYFWQFTIFDGNDLEEVYIAPYSSSKSKPTFSHHKLTVFEYADGVNNVEYGNNIYTITDLDMYYAKVGNGYNQGSTREIVTSQKYPEDPAAFEKQRPEYEIVGAFAPDPLEIASIQAGSLSSGVSSTISVKTKKPHNFQVGTPIKIKGANPPQYNISAVVTFVSDTDNTLFTYTLPGANGNDLGTGTGDVSSATVTIETDTVEGSSPYIFNCSMRSVYGMNGLRADGNTATGFKSMVVAQFTGVSLQKDDRAFVKYSTDSREYEPTSLPPISEGTDLSSGSSQTGTGQALHLDSGAIYRQGWETTHINMENDAILQIVSVFAIGYAKHFTASNGSDASITNSNSNFGQLSLISDGFKKEAFDKDNKAFITSIIPPRSITTKEEEIDWVAIDTAEVDTSKLYLYGYTSKDNPPLINAQGYKIGARLNGKLYLNILSTTYQAEVLMPTGQSSRLEYSVTDVPDKLSNNFTIGTHQFTTGEKVIVTSETGDLPESIETDVVYYVITKATKDTIPSSSDIQLATSESNAINGSELTVAGGTGLKIISRVSDKIAGDINSPVQFDTSKSKWYIVVNPVDNTITGQLTGQANLGDVSTDNTYIKRKIDERSLDEKIYKVRVVIPKELGNAKNPENGFIIQESSTTGARSNTDFNLSSVLTPADYEFKKNPGFIATCTSPSISGIASVTTELPHYLNTGDTVIIKNVTDSINVTGTANTGYNGTYDITVVDDMRFTYQPTKNHGVNLTNDTLSRTIDLPRFERNNLQDNLYVYRNEIVNEYIDGKQDGVYHLYVLNANYQIPTEFTDYAYGQNVTDLYPQLDRDNSNDNPPSASSYAVRNPLGKVVTNELKKSITRETIDKLSKVLGIGVTVSSISDNVVTFARKHGFSGIQTGTLRVAGSSYPTDGTYYNIKLLSGGYTSTTGIWNGATAHFDVVGGSIVSASLNIQSPGCGYTATDGGTTDLYFDEAVIGAPSSRARLQLYSSGISSAIGNVVQFTGVGTTDDGYYRITSVPSSTTISIAKTSGDPAIVPNQYAIPTAPSIVVTGSPTAVSNGISTINTVSSHGLTGGNSIKLVDSNNNNLGSWIVNTVVDVNTFSVADIPTGLTLGAPTYVYKEGFSANAKASDRTEENLQARAISPFENNYSRLGAELTDSSSTIQLTTTSGIATNVFPYGSYLQVDGEIMRVASPSVSGVGNNQLTVIRGALATGVTTHVSDSLVKSIRPIPIEFRRPSILRASGHTFEYLGYGPGNYSTALPQVQNITLTEREEFLSQSQEKSGGIVVYTGMNNKGDFFIGNQKKSSATGEEVTFDTPVATVTGEDPAKLSLVTDEITVKERLLVEGGKSRLVLSQFDGPVTFNKDVRINGDLSFSGAVRIKDQTDSTSTNSGALRVAGGVGIGSNLYVGGGTTMTGRLTGAGATFSGDLYAANISSGSSITAGNWNGSKYAGKLYGDGSAITDITIPGSATPLHLNDNVALTLGNTVSDPDLIIKHDGSNSIIREEGTGSLYLQSAANVIITKESGNNNDICADFNTVGPVTLYHNSASAGSAAKKFETTEDGITVQGEGRFVGGDVIAFATSDKRLKDNISPIKQALDKVKSISGNTFDWNEASGKEGSEVGVIAQEVDALNLPGITTIRDDGTYAVRYEKLIPILIEAIKELSAKVDTLESMAHPKPTGKTQKRNEDRLDALENKINN